MTHATPVLRLAPLPSCINRSASRLLGLEPHNNGGFHRGRPAQRFDEFDKCPELAPEALAEAQEAFESRQGERYSRMAPIVGRLAEALARDGQFASEDRILDVAISLERMYELDQGEVSFKLKTRAACFLESDTEARLRVFKDVGEFYGARSEDRSQLPKETRVGGTARSGFQEGLRCSPQVCLQALAGRVAAGLE